MKHDDKVSIIIPVFNAEQSIRRCIDSVISQTYKNIEIIIINDGSTDQSRMICENIQSERANIKLINQENSGPSAARNNGLKSSSGNYIQFVDSDDYIEENMTQILVAGISSNSSLVVSGYNKFHYDRSNNIQLTEKFPSIYGTFSKDEYLNNFGEYAKQNLTNQLWNKLYLSKIIRDNLITFQDDVRMGEDLLFNLKYLEKCSDIDLIDDRLYNYITLDENSLTRSYQKDRFANQKMLFSEVANFLSDNDAFHENNEIAIAYLYFKSLISGFINIVNMQSTLKHKDKLRLIDEIINDDTVIKLLSVEKMIELSSQEKLLYKLMKRKNGFMIYQLFVSKKIIQKYFFKIMS